MAELFRDTVYLMRQDKEKDYLKLSRIQERFDQFRDPDQMQNIPKSQYDLMDSEQEDDAGTTEFSDCEMNDLYKRYRLIQKDLTEETETLAERDKYYVQSKIGHGRAKDPMRKGSWRSQLIREDTKVFEKKRIINSIETQLATVRMLRHLKKMHPLQLVDESDSFFQETWTPFEYMRQEIMNDPELPQEVRKVISVVRAEQQYGTDQIQNAQEAEEFEALDEL